MLKHIVFNQKKAAKKKNCIDTAEKRRKNETEINLNVLFVVLEWNKVWADGL